MVFLINGNGQRRARSYDDLNPGRIFGFAQHDRIPRDDAALFHAAYGPYGIIDEPAEAGRASAA